MHVAQNLVLLKPQYPDTARWSSSHATLKTAVTANVSTPLPPCHRQTDRLSEILQSIIALDINLPTIKKFHYADLQYCRRPGIPYCRPSIWNNLPDTVSDFSSSYSVDYVSPSTENLSVLSLSFSDIILDY